MQPGTKRVPTYGEARHAAQRESRERGIEICDAILAGETNKHVRRDAMAFREALRVAIAEDARAGLVAKDSPVLKGSSRSETDEQVVTSEGPKAAPSVPKP